MWIAVCPLFPVTASKKIYYDTHPIKAARTAALCWVFSIVQRKDRPSCGTVLTDFPMGGAGKAVGEAGTKWCPHERGHHVHGTSREHTPDIRDQTI